jgi:hypothetical protein
MLPSAFSTTTCVSRVACTATYQLYRAQVGPRPITRPDLIYQISLRNVQEVYLTRRAAHGHAWSFGPIVHAETDLGRATPLLLLTVYPCELLQGCFLRHLHYGELLDGPSKKGNHRSLRQKKFLHL